MSLPSDELDRRCGGGVGTSCDVQAARPLWPSAGVCVPTMEMGAPTSPPGQGPTTWQVPPWHSAGSAGEARSEVRWHRCCDGPASTCSAALTHVFLSYSWYSRKIRPCSRHLEYWFQTSSFNGCANSLTSLHRGLWMVEDSV